MASHISGAVAELGLVEWKGWPWRAPINTFKDSDLPGGIEVKSKMSLQWDSNGAVKFQNIDKADVYVFDLCMADIYPHALPLSVWRIDGWQLKSVIMATPLVRDAYNGEAWHYPLDQLQHTDTLAAEMARRGITSPTTPPVAVDFNPGALAKYFQQFKAEVDHAA